MDSVEILSELRKAFTSENIKVRCNHDFREVADRVCGTLDEIEKSKIIVILITNEYLNSHEFSNVIAVVKKMQKPAVYLIMEEINEASNVNLIDLNQLNAIEFSNSMTTNAGESFQQLRYFVHLSLNIRPPKFYENCVPMCRVSYIRAIDLGSVTMRDIAFIKHLGVYFLLTASNQCLALSKKFSIISFHEFEKKPDGRFKYVTITYNDKYENTYITYRIESFVDGFFCNNFFVQIYNKDFEFKKSR